MAQQGNNLSINIVGSADAVTINDWFGANTSSQLTAIKLENGYEIDNRIADLVTSTASYQAANPNFTPSTAASMPSDQALQNAVSLAWHR
jgi:hypothetical protein